MSLTKAAAIVRAALAPKAVQPGFVIRDAQAFFGAVKLVTGRLSQPQVDTINAVLQAAKHWPLPWVAYALATAWHEARLIPQREWGRGKGRRYGRPGARMTPNPALPTYAPNVPYGRGLVQITWVENYEWLDKATSDAGLIPPGALLQDFDLALRPDIAVLALLTGMEEGRYNPKGKGIRAYIPNRLATRADYVAARWLVNLQDKADLIAGHALKFGAALHRGGWER